MANRWTTTRRGSHPCSTASSAFRRLSRRRRQQRHRGVHRDPTDTCGRHPAQPLRQYAAPGYAARLCGGDVPGRGRLCASLHRHPGLLPVEQSFPFSQPVPARFVRLVLVNSYNADYPYGISLGEFKVVATPGADVGAGSPFNLADPAWVATWLPSHRYSMIPSICCSTIRKNRPSPSKIRRFPSRGRWVSTRTAPPRSRSFNGRTPRKAIRASVSVRWT